MLRTCTGLMIVAAGMTLGGCGNQWMNSWTDRSGEPQEAVRFDANGNKMYDASVRNTGSGNYAYNANGDMARNRDGNNRGNAWSNDQRNTSSDSRYTQDDRHAMRNDEKIWENWNDRNVTTMQTTDLPQPVLATFQRHCGGADLMGTGWANYEGKRCYCAKTRKDGMTYEMISDADGNLIGMKRID